MKRALILLSMLWGIMLAQQNTFHFHNSTQTKAHTFKVNEPLTEITFQKSCEYLSSLRDTTELNEKTTLFIADNNLRAFQIARLMDLFETDIDKLKVALEAYPRCVDKDKYYIVSYKLKLETNKQRLEEFTGIKGIVPKN